MYYYYFCLKHYNIFSREEHDHMAKESGVARHKFGIRARVGFVTTTHTQPSHAWPKLETVSASLQIHLGF